MSESGKTFLIVDDNELLCKTVCSCLEEAGHECHYVTDGSLTKSWLEKNPCDAVIVDLGMDGMNGFDVVRELRSAFPDLVIIVFTGEGYDEEKMAHAKANGADAYVAKGLPIKEILDAMINAIYVHAASKRHQE